MLQWYKCGAAYHFHVTYKDWISHLILSTLVTTLHFHVTYKLRGFSSDYQLLVTTLHFHVTYKWRVDGRILVYL